ncbi:MAG: efflux transporter outer membrane subunit [Acidobacteriota bacterium]
MSPKPSVGRRQVVTVAILMIACFVLPGCTVGPDYQAPTVAAPADWVARESPSLEPGAEVLAEWWTRLEDPLLSELLTRAVASNHDLRVAEARVREARAQRRVASAKQLPKIDGSADATRFRLSRNGVGIGSVASQQGLVNQEDDFFQAGVDTSWELDLFGGIRRTVEGAEARARAADEERRGVLLSVLAEVASSYVELRGAERRLQVAEDNIRIQRETLELVANKVETGLSRRLEEVRASALLAATRSSIPTLEAARRISSYRLAVLLGEEPGALANELAAAAPVPLPPELVPIGLPSELLRRRPDVRAAERRLAAATADIGVAVAELYPRFVLAGAVGGESASVSNLLQSASRTWLLQPSLRLPIFQRRIRANIKAVEARTEQMLARYEQAVLRAVEETESAIERYVRQRQAGERLGEAVAASRRAVELAEVLYSRGLTDQLTVLDAQRTLNDVEDRLALSDTALATQVIAIYKALGGGWQAFEPSAAEKVAAPVGVSAP